VKSIHLFDNPLVVCLGLTFLAASLRFYHIGANSLWVDEVLTARAVELPFSDILRNAIRENSVPPLFFWACHLIVRAVGESEASLRFISALGGSLTIPIFFLLMREITAGPMAACLSACLLAVNPLHVWFSQEARPYALMTFFGCLSLLFLARGLRKETLADWFGCVAGLTSAFMAHTLGLIFVVAAWCWLALRKNKASDLRAFGAVTLVFALCAAPFLIAIGSRKAVSHAPPREASAFELPYALFTFVAGYSFGPTPRDIQNLGAMGAVKAHAIQTALAGVIGMGLAGLILTRHRPQTNLLWLVLLLSLILPLVGSRLTDHPFNVRYTLSGLLGLLGLAGIALAGLPAAYKTGGATLLIALSLGSDFQWFTSPHCWKEDSRGAVAYLARHLPPGARVGVAPDYTTLPLDYYAAMEGVRLTLVPVSTTSDLRAAAALVISREHHVSNARTLEAAFVEHAGAVTRRSLVGYRIFVAE